MLCFVPALDVLRMISLIRRLGICSLLETTNDYHACFMISSTNNHNLSGCGAKTKVHRAQYFFFFFLHIYFSSGILQ